MIAEIQKEITNLLTGEQVAQKLNISKSFAYRLMQRGELPFVQIGRAVRVRESDLRQYIVANLNSSKEV